MRYLNMLQAELKRSEIPNQGGSSQMGRVKAISHHLLLFAAEGIEI